MSMNAIGIAGSGLDVNRQWLNAISDNIANMNNATATSGPAFQARYVVAEAGAGTSGVFVKGTVLGDSTGIVVNDPSNPLADAQGNVRMPDINLGDQMGQLIMAQRAYEANAKVVSDAQATYQAAIAIGKGN
ncbi:flagellar basal body rod protein FlgC [Lysinimonas soli]|uniref:Flagellar basal body rod protein FlgC n=1 Tax=Lysinimonas soli TaxID=1074233 RepID=A0ABW0NRQ8_9MICO